MTHELQIKGLEVSIAGKKILRGVDLTVRQGEVHAIMGPNGSGKTSLAYALMGHPDYHVDAGSVTWRGEPILGLAPDVRARLGIFLAFQYPSAIPGVTVASFLRNIYNAVHHPKPVGDDGQAATRYTGIPLAKFRKLLEEKMSLLRMDPSFATRYVNEGFSGGEKKRLEMLQMAVIEPEMAILDETDSGLDIDALRIVAEGVNAMLNPELGVLLITHYQRLLNHIKPDVVHVLAQGRIVKSGGRDLALQLEEEGYGPILREAGLETTASDEALQVPKGTDLEIEGDHDREPVEAAR
jgi:Fe-S cluster assembly ATP-binding protein